MPILAPSILLAFASGFGGQEGNRPAPPRLEDFPAPLRPYLEVGLELEGLEQSLALQLGLQLGLAAERERVPAEYRPDAKHHREDWNAELAALLDELGPRAAAGARVGGALFLDTGVRMDPETRQVEVLRKPDIRLVPSERYAELAERRRLLAAYPERLGAADAERLRAILEEVAGPLEERKNPWLGHAEAHLVFIGIGAWEDYARDLRAGGTPFGTFDEFLALVEKELRIALVDPLVPQLEESERAGRNYRFECDVLVLAHDAEDEWTPPAELVATNALDRVATLVIQVPARERYARKTKLDRAVIGLVAGGAQHVLYEGELPID